MLNHHTDDRLVAAADWLRMLRQQLRDTRQRRLLSCQGSMSWCDQCLDLVQSQCESIIILSERELSAESVAFSKAETLLGQEAEVVVVDLFDGLQADVVCIASGLVLGGGVLLLLSPQPHCWSQIVDHYGIWQNRVASPRHHFIDYFFAQIRADTSACIEWRQGAQLPVLLVPPQASLTALVAGLTHDQARVLQQVEPWLRQSGSRIILITADRGRGKSTCLGLIVRQLLAAGDESVCVTAHSRLSATVLLSQCETVRFSAADALLAEQQTAGSLVIDEAAILPYSLLEQLCQRFSRVIMATTTGGYEGTGQGFMLRFIAALPQSRLLHLTLHEPVRWGAGDCLENWLERTCLYSVPPDTGENHGIHRDLSTCGYRVLEHRTQSDQTLIADVYRLMVSAHYRTQPSDLRALMENPDLIPLIATGHKKLFGVALLNVEGGFDVELCRQVFLGRRRPTGHLLAQMLTAQAGVKYFACFRGLRIQRIAVTEALRWQGVGRGLTVAAEDYARQRKDDYIGASFAFDKNTLGFWRACGFRLVHIGYGKGKSSGRYSVAVIKLLNPALESAVDQLQQKMRQSLALWFCQWMNMMDTQSTAALLRYSGYQTQFCELENNEIDAFIQGCKGFELCFVTLQRLTMLLIAQSPDDFVPHHWLVEKVIQNRDWNQLTRDPECDGRKSIQNKIRRLLADLMTEAAASGWLL